MAGRILGRKKTSREVCVLPLSIFYFISHTCPTGSCLPVSSLICPAVSLSVCLTACLALILVRKLTFFNEGAHKKSSYFPCLILFSEKFTKNSKNYLESANSMKKEAAAYVTLMTR